MTQPSLPPRIYIFFIPLPVVIVSSVSPRENWILLCVPDPPSPCSWIIFTVIFHLSDIDSLGLDNNPLILPLSPFYTFQSCFEPTLQSFIHPRASALAKPSNERKKDRYIHWDINKIIKRVVRIDNYFDK